MEAYKAKNQTQFLGKKLDTLARLKAEILARKKPRKGKKKEFFAILISVWRQREKGTKAHRQRGNFLKMHTLRKRP
jgi:hypothetical protein